MFIKTDAIFKTPIEANLLELFEQNLVDTPYRIVDLDCRIGGKSLLRIFIEQKDTGTASVEDCAKVSRLLDPVIEASQVFTGPFELEVSSPGIDRRLRLKADFEKAVGREVKLEFTEKLEGVGGSVRGILEKVENGDLILKSQGKQVPIQMNKVQRAQSFSNV